MYDLMTGNLSLTRHQWPVYCPHLMINFINPFPLLTTCFSSSALGDVRFLPKHHEDFIFWANLLSTVDCSNVGHCNVPGAYYRVSTNSVSSDKFKSFLWLLSCYKELKYPGYTFPCRIIIWALIQISFRIIPLIRLPNFLKISLKSLASR